MVGSRMPRRQARCCLALSLALSACRMSGASRLEIPTAVLSPRAAPAAVVARVDHLVYAAPDLDIGVATLERLTGVRASPGGSHPGAGTRNALLALGPSAYLEIMAPDPALPPSAQPLPFGLDTLTVPRLVAWGANPGDTDLDALALDAERQGIRLGAVRAGSRARPDGVILAWRFSDPRTIVADHLVPFFIDWGRSPHPASSAAPGLTLVNLRGEHPAADSVRTLLRHLGLALDVRPATRPGLVATILGPHGRVDIR